MASSHETTITVVACRKVYTGRNAHHQSFTIFEVDAKNVQGQLISQQLRSFVPLPVGETVEVTVTPFKSTEYGDCYTLHPKDAPAEESSPQLQELIARVQQMAEHVGDLIKRVRELEESVTTIVASQKL